MTRATHRDVLGRSLVGGPLLEGSRAKGRWGTPKRRPAVAVGGRGEEVRRGLLSGLNVDWALDAADGGRAGGVESCAGRFLLRWRSEILLRRAGDGRRRSRCGARGENWLLGLGKRRR
jgi:hypothetical protein